jgi:hypothetical protein
MICNIPSFERLQFAAKKKTYINTTAKIHAIKLINNYALDISVYIYMFMFTIVIIEAV